MQDSDDESRRAANPDDEEDEDEDDEDRPAAPDGIDIEPSATAAARALVASRNARLVAKDRLP